MYFTAAVVAFGQECDMIDDGLRTTALTLCTYDIPTTCMRPEWAGNPHKGFCQSRSMVSPCVPEFV